MKKLISILLLAFAIVCATNEAKSQALTSSMYTIDGSAYGYFYGATTDTLIASGYRIQPIRMKGDNMFIIDLQLTCTKVSGTVTNKLYIEKSMDNSNWTKVDSIVLTGASSGVSYKQIDSWNYPYLRLNHVAPATVQKAYYKIWYVARKK
jgi:hypothetical protein